MSVTQGIWTAPNYLNTVQATKSAPQFQNTPAWSSGGKSHDPWQRAGIVPMTNLRVMPAAGGRTIGTGPGAAPPTRIPIPPIVAHVYTGTGIPANGGATRMASKRL
jgi:hypothetical protein